MEIDLLDEGQRARLDIINGIFNPSSTNQRSAPQLSSLDTEQPPVTPSTTDIITNGSASTSQEIQVYPQFRTFTCRPRIHSAKVVKRFKGRLPDFTVDLRSSFCRIYSPSYKYTYTDFPRRTIRPIMNFTELYCWAHHDYSRSSFRSLRSYITRNIIVVGGGASGAHGTITLGDMGETVFFPLPTTSTPLPD